MKKQELLLGDEAVALAALHAGISGAYSYPGTPATEILEYVQSRAKEFNVTASWSANEKVAYEGAIGMSYCGKRALTSMKHVGLNVAADPFVNSGITGVDGGLVLCVADDPGMHSSQNEQDSRYLARFALIPCLEPLNQQEAYDMTREAFDLSERFKTPVMVRIVTRLAHSRAGVVTMEGRAQNALRITEDAAGYILLPSNARIQYDKLAAKQSALEEYAAKSPHNRICLDGDRKLGILCNAMAFNYVREAFPAGIPHPYVKVGCYPTPMGMIRKLVETVDEIVVVEEGYPFLEELLRGVVGVAGKAVHGKLDGRLPRTGELTPAIAARAFGIAMESAFAPTLEKLPGRPPALCPGCPHADSYRALKLAAGDFPKVPIFSDIGCYTLSFYPPYNAVDSCVDMGASIAMAIGAAHAGIHPVMCSIGDSTFGHSGMTGLLTAAYEKLPMTVFILDNGTVAMTGKQDTLLTGDALVNAVIGLGVEPEHVRVLSPLPKNLEENARIIREELAYKGLSVIIPKRDCVQAKR
ncbi:MAG: indolepyruvate ferredoxin oxidoreductase [Deltaproteobacteria bacterium]|nr:indolepyruvate ferredoxin oxidoreductase [Deltaproteobacteria bacterium]